MTFFDIFAFIKADGCTATKNASHRLKVHIISYILKKKSKTLAASTNEIFKFSVGQLVSAGTTKHDKQDQKTV